MAVARSNNNAVLLGDTEAVYHAKLQTNSPLYQPAMVDTLEPTQPALEAAS